jgi:hypothetical protein
MVGRWLDSRTNINFIMARNATSAVVNDSRLCLFRGSRMDSEKRVSSPDVYSHTTDGGSLSHSYGHPGRTNCSISSNLFHHRSSSFPSISTCSIVTSSRETGKASNGCLHPKISQIVHANVQTSNGKDRGLSRSPASANRASGGASNRGVWAVYCFVSFGSKASPRSTILIGASARVTLSQSMPNHIGITSSGGTPGSRAAPSSRTTYWLVLAYRTSAYSLPTLRSPI